MPKTTLVHLESDADTGTAIVSCPRHPAFLSFAHNHSATWLPASKAWRFDLRSLPELKQLLVKLYGTAGNDVPTADIRVTARALVRATRTGIFLLGREAIRAFSRDSGVRPGPGTIILEGNADSGGSAANWQTIVHPGTTLELRDVPVTLIERFRQTAQNPAFPWDPPIDVNTHSPAAEAHAEPSP